jgi:hypothetical protein
MRLTTYVRLVPRLKMSGAIPQILHTSLQQIQGKIYFRLMGKNVYFHLISER